MECASNPLNLKEPAFHNQCNLGLEGCNAGLEFLGGLSGGVRCAYFGQRSAGFLVSHFPGEWILRIQDEKPAGREGGEHIGKIEVEEGTGN